MTHDLILDQPGVEIDKMVTFIRKTMIACDLNDVVIGVSGGIDSAVSLSLCVKALGAAHVFPFLLPYGKQDMGDAQLLCEWWQLLDNTQLIDIKPLVSGMQQTLSVPTSATVRLGNIMARVRMTMVFDSAKRRCALVCGTENKSEHYLGYFTRFGDAASDLEPIAHLWKTQVRQLAKALELPQQVLDKPPSAGLWEHQTDEAELGFSYDDADQALHAFIDERIEPAKIQIEGVDQSVIDKVLAQVASQSFKHHVPYTLLHHVER